MQCPVMQRPKLKLLIPDTCRYRNIMAYSIQQQQVYCCVGTALHSYKGGGGGGCAAAVSFCGVFWAKGFAVCAPTTMHVLQHQRQGQATD